MRSGSIVEVDERRQAGDALGGVMKGTDVGPFGQQGADEAFGLANGLWPVGARAARADSQLGAGSAEVPAAVGIAVSSRPLPGSSMTRETEDRLTLAMGPEEGPGSGGRKKIAAVSAAIHPREHRVFLGAFDPNDPPTSMQERLVRLMPAAKRILPTGDFREWDAIETWAREIAAELVAKVPIA